MVTLFEKYYNTMAGLMYVSSEVSWWAGGRDRLPGCTLWKLTKLEPNIQCTRLPMQSNGNCGLVVQRCALPIEIWTTDRQDIRSDICVEADLNDSDQWCYRLNCSVCVCVCCAQLKFSSEQPTDRIKGHVSGPTDETKGDLNDSDQWPVMLSTELNCVCFRYKVVHSGNWQFYSSHTGCKIRWSGDQCNILERRHRLNSCALLKFE